MIRMIRNAMIPRTILILMLACIALVAQGRAAQANDDETTLKKRFESRYLTLLALKDDGRVGETSTGWAEAVRLEYLTQRVDENNAESPTVRDFLLEENADRQKLYTLIAKKTSATEQDVAKRNARRLFQKASPEHFLKLPDDRWVQKKDLRKSE